MTAQEYIDRMPLPATGRLKELEEMFLTNKKIKNRHRIVTLLDRAKRSMEYDKDELERLINTKT